ncbi:MAG: zinc dependent phospholipase C family protein [Anaerolineae bacterium]
MSDLLTHWAVFEDCRRLMLLDDRVDPLLARVMHAEREFARLGAIARSGARFVPHVLRSAREAYRQDGEVSPLRRKLAFALGGITHYAADVIMKPLLKSKTQMDWNEAHHRMQHGDSVPDSPIREISAYYDTHVFRKVYLAGQEEPFNRFLLAENATEPGRALEEFVFALFQRALLASHTLAPDEDDLDGWLDNLIARVQPLYVDVRTFVRVFAAPDPDKMRAYGVEDAFYLEDDPAIRAARSAQAGQAIRASELATALNEAANTSGYAKAVCRGLQRLREASMFWRGACETMPDLRQ